LIIEWFEVVICNFMISLWDGFVELEGEGADGEMLGKSDIEETKSR